MLQKLQADYDAAICGEVSEETVKRNEILAKEIYLSVGRYGYSQRIKQLEDKSSL